MRVERFCIQTLKYIKKVTLTKQNAHRIINVTFRWNEEKREKTLIENAVFAPAESRKLLGFQRCRKERFALSLEAWGVFHFKGMFVEHDRMREKRTRRQRYEADFRK